MIKQKLKIWSNNYFPGDRQPEQEFLHRQLAEYDFRLFPPKEHGAGGESRQFLSQADIAFGQPDADALLISENLRWVQISSAGYAPYERADLKEILQQRGAILTNSSAVFDEPCAQHLLAMILSFARSLPRACDEQRGKRDWISYPLRSRIHLLNKQTVLILGFGAIGRRLAELLAPFRMHVAGVKRTIRGDEPVKIIPESQVDEFLTKTDHLVNILPANEATRHFLNAERQRNLKSGAIIYNVGRGTTIDQKALIENLYSGHLGGAYLDVTEPEPLPPHDPLWSAPNCYITPHVAGGHAEEKLMQIKHFLENLRRFDLGENLINRII